MFLWALGNAFIQSALSQAVQLLDATVFSFPTGPANGTHVTLRSSNAITLVFFMHLVYFVFAQPVS